MITETGYSTAWTFAGGNPATSGSPDPALNLVNQWTNGTAFWVNFTARDNASAAIDVASVFGLAEDQTAGDYVGGFSIKLYREESSLPYSTIVHFSEKQRAIYVDRDGSGPHSGLALGKDDHPFWALYIGNSEGGSSSTYKLFVDPADNTLKVSNPSGVFTTLATP
jgi:hypothetical protein